jgi:hypothetical protein
MFEIYLKNISHVMHFSETREVQLTIFDPTPSVGADVD